MREIAKEKSNGKLTERIYREFDARFCSLPETPPLATGNYWKFPGIQTGDFGLRGQHLLSHLSQSVWERASQTGNNSIS